MKKLTFLLLTLMAVSAVPAAAQFGWPRDLQPQLRSVDVQMRELGYSQIGGASAGSIEQGAMEYFDLHLTAGHYAVFAVCDANCGNINLAILGPRSRIIARDRSTGDTAKVETTQTEDATVRLRVEMDSCMSMSESCRFAIVVFGK